jgi:hypothetical protein
MASAPSATPSERQHGPVAAYQERRLRSCGPGNSRCPRAVTEEEHRSTRCSPRALAAELEAAPHLHINLLADYRSGHGRESHHVPAHAAGRSCYLGVRQAMERQALLRSAGAWSIQIWTYLVHPTD